MYQKFSLLVLFFFLVSSLSFNGFVFGEDNDSCLKDAKNITSSTDKISVDLSTYNYFSTPIDPFVGVQYTVSSLCSNFSVFIGDGKVVFCPNKTSNNATYLSANGTISFFVYYPESKGYYISILVDDKNCNNHSLFQINIVTKTISTNSTVNECNATSIRNCTANGGLGFQECVIDRSTNASRWGNCTIRNCPDKSKTIKDNVCVSISVQTHLLPVTVGFIVGGVVLSVIVVVVGVVYEYLKANKSRKGYTVVE